MKSWHGCVMVGVLTAASLVAHAADAPATAPTTAPTTSPTTQASVPIDQKSPKGALKLLTQSVEQGDGDAVRGLLYSTTPAEQRISDLFCNLIPTTAKLKSAARATFGEEKARDLTGPPNAAAQIYPRIDAAQESLQGDKAIVREGQGPGIKLLRIDGNWRIPVTEIPDIRDMLGNVDGAELDARIVRANAEAKAISDTADDITAGKFKTVDEAIQSLRTRVVKAGQATTKPK